MEMDIHSVNQQTTHLLWSEGLLLTQQHLQWHDWLNSQHMAKQRLALSEDCAGWISCEWDTLALLEGRYQLTTFEVIMPNGQYYHYYYSPGELPLVACLPESENSVTLYLSLPETDSATIPGYPQQARVNQWHVNQAILPDRYDHNRSQSIQIITPNWQLSTEHLEGSTTLIAVQLVRKVGHQWIVKANSFVPCVRISGCQALLDRLTALIEIISHEGFKRLEDKWQHVALSQSLYTLKSLHHAKAHPRQLFESAVKTALIFDEPPCLHYDHRQFQACWDSFFDYWDKWAEKPPKQQAETVISPQTVSEGKWLWQAIPPEAFDFDNWYLVVACNQMFSESQATKLIEEIKIAAAQTIHQLATLALNGLQLTFVPKPSLSLYEQTQGCFFKLENKGLLWEQVVEQRAMMVRLPVQYEHLTLSWCIAK